MKKGLFVLFDNLSQEIATTIIISENDDTIMRNIKDAQLPDTMEKHPEDYDLISLGFVDTVEAQIFPEHRIVCHLGALKHGKE